MQTKEKTQYFLDINKPKMFHVVLLNDDYTTMEFVVKILTDIFYHTPKTAMDIMLNIHEKGEGICGTYIYEIASAKLSLVKEKSYEEGFPLRVIIKEADDK